MGAWTLLLWVGLAAAHGDLPGWERFPVFVWFVQGGPPQGEAAFRELAAHGLDGVNLEASQSHGPAARDAGLRVYVGHAAGKGDLHLRRERFQEDFDRFWAQRGGPPPRRPSCLSDPALRDALRDRVRATVERQQSSRPLGYSLDDEISVTVGLNPFDYCFDPRCLASFRTWLKGQYGSLELLNATWGSSFPRWEDVVPGSTDEVRRGLGERPLEEVRLASWADHRAFMDELMARRVEDLVGELGRLAPGVPAGFLGGQAPSAFGGFDWWRLTRRGTFFEAYDYGCAPRLAGDFAPPGARRITTLFLDEGGRAVESVTRALWRAVGRGEDGVVVWASDRVFQGSVPVLSEAGLALAEQVRRVREVRGLLEGRERTPPRVGVYVSMPSVRAGWMLDSWSDGSTWPRRFTSWEQEHSRTIQSREAWAMLLDDAGVSWRFLDSRQFLAGGGEGTGLDVLVLHETMALSDEEVEELLRFVEAGGTLVADAHVGLFDEHLVGRDPSALRRLFGLTRDVSVPFSRFARRMAGDSAEGRGDLGLPRGEPGLTPVAGLRAGPLGWRRKVGAGTTLLMDLDLVGAIDAAASQAEALAPLRDLLWELWSSASVAPAVRVRPVGEEPAVWPVFFDGAEGPALLLLPVRGTWEPHPLELEFPEPVRLRSIPGGAPAAPGRRHRVQVPARDALLVTW